MYETKMNKNPLVLLVFLLALRWAPEKFLKGFTFKEMRVGGHTTA